MKYNKVCKICIVERHPFSENFLLKRTGMLFLKSLELCLAHCRVLSVPGKCHAVLFSGEEKVCLLLRQNQPLQSRDVMRKSESQLFTLNYCYYNMTKSSERRYYNGTGNIINLRIGSMRIQCTVHEIPLLRKHTEHQCLLWNSKTFRHCIKFCARQFRAMDEQQEYQQGSAINRIQPDETSISSPSIPISSTTHNICEQELDFFHYVGAENVKEGYAKLYEFFEICEVQLLNIGLIRNASAILIPRKIYSLNRCLHICRRHTSCMAILFSQLHHKCKKIFKGRSSSSILVHADETVVALKECYKDRPDERKCNTEPLIYYFEQTQEICAVEIYKQKNLTSWEVMAINKDVSNFQACLFKCIINNECCAINYFPTKECYLIKPADESHIFIVKDNSIFAEELYCESGTLVDFTIK
ncbi:hypothetical protein T09_8293 [Trichinella sp. T9]|nr:hypothetical protein T09_8293 [Trichinella sp. T9]